MTIKRQIAPQSRMRPSGTLRYTTGQTRNAAMWFHPDEHSLDQYILGHLDEQQTRELEVHLAGCGQCTGRLKEASDYVRAMQAALAEARCEN